MSFVPANAVCLSGRYTLLERVGAGGEGQVWRARDHERGIELALKILNIEHALSPAAWEGLRREFNIASRLDHPSILKVYPPERDGDVVFLPMELVRGGDVGRLRRASYIEIGPVLLEAARALAHMHERGLVHRDLKPGNVLLDAEGHVRLADFGVAARALEVPSDSAPPDPASVELARRGFSPFTASPEQLRGEPPSVADDIYGLGALACELLTGHLPYYPQLDRARRFEELPRIEPAHRAPERLIALVRAMLSKNAERRPQSMREVAERLEAALGDTLTFDDRTVEPPALAEDHEPSAPVPLAERILSVRRIEPVAPVTTIAAVEPLRPAATAPPAEPMRPDARADAARPIDVDPVSAAEPPTIRAVRDPPPLEFGYPAGRPRPRARRSARWPWVLVIVAASAAAFFALRPRASMPVPAWTSHSLDSLHALAPRQMANELAQRLGGLASTPRSGVAANASLPRASATTAVVPRGAEPGASVRAARVRVAARLRQLEARGAADWGGSRYARAGLLAAEADGASEAGDPTLAARKLSEAERLIDELERAAPRELAAAQRTQAAGRVLPLLVEGLDAEVAHDEARAERAFSRVLALDPGNAVALAGERRARAALERPAEPHPERAAASDLIPAAAAVPRVVGRVPVAAGLTRRIRALVDDPSSLATGAIRDEAAALVREERAMPRAGTELRSLAAELAYLVKEYGKTVRVALISDNETQVQITEIGSFGAFLRRDIDLRPGEYTVIGTRPGYRKIEREVTIAPGGGVHEISVACDQPI